MVTLACLALAGCQSSGPLLSRRSEVGSLKASLGQLEKKNDRLDKQLAELKTENRRLDDQLVQERTDNDDLATRLDDVKGLLAERGIDSRVGIRPVADPVDNPSSRSRSTKTKRKPPSASIPIRVEPVGGSDDVSLGETTPWRSQVADRRTARNQWLPIAAQVGGSDGATRK